MTDVKPQGRGDKRSTGIAVPSTKSTVTPSTSKMTTATVNSTLEAPKTTPSIPKTTLLAPKTTSAPPTKEKNFAPDVSVKPVDGPAAASKVVRGKKAASTPSLDVTTSSEGTNESQTTVSATKKPRAGKTIAKVTAPKENVVDEDISPLAQKAPDQQEGGAVRRADGLIVLDQRSHVLYRPDVYLGSTKQIERTVMTYDGQSIQWKSTTLPRALERMPLEANENGFDAYKRGDKDGVVDRRPLRFSIDNRWTVRVWNGGKILPVVQHSSGHGYYPYVAFFVLNTSDNYTEAAIKNEVEKVGKRDYALKGRNGWGSKLPSILSEESEVISADGKKMMIIRSKNNMRTVEVVSISQSAERFVQFSYTPDRDRFDGYREYDDVAMELFRAHALSFSYCNNRDVIFSVDGQDELFPAITIYEFTTKAFPDYQGKPIVGYLWEPGQKFSISRTKKGYLELPEQGEMPTLEFAILFTPHEGRAISFVNGSLTIDNGSHVEAIYAALRKYCLPKGSNLNISYIRKHISLIVSCNVLEDPQMESNAKTRLVAPTFHVELNDRIKKEIDGLGLRALLEEEARMKLEISAVAPIKKRIGAVEVEKLTDADYASLSHSKRDGKPLTLFIVEGNSAKNMAIRYTEDDREHCGVYPIRGKPPNAQHMEREKLFANEEVKAICEILGLDPRVTYDEDPSTITTKRYDKIAIMTDEDEDAIHIRVLLTRLFSYLFPAIVEWDGVIEIVETPLLLVKLPKQLLAFYTKPDYDLWCSHNRGLAQKYPPKYCKGLSAFSKEEVEYCREESLIYHLPVIYDEKYRDSYSFLLDRARQDEKKAWITAYDHQPLPKLVGSLTVTDLIMKHMPRYCYASIVRGIPGIDGFKQSSRKVISGSLLEWNGGTQTYGMTVDSLAGTIKKTMSYHPSLDTLYDIIGRMTCSHPGSNNLPLFSADSMFRDRMNEEDGKARYMTTSPVRGLWPLLFPPTFRKITPRVFYESLAEFEKIVSCVPLLLIEGSKGLSEGWKNDVLPCRPQSVIDFVRVLIRGEYDPRKRYLVPWFNGFKGTVMMVRTEELSKRDRENKHLNRRAITGVTENWTDEDALPVEGDDSALFSTVITGAYTVQANGKVVVSEILPSDNIPSYDRFLVQAMRPPVDAEGKPLLDDAGNPVPPLIMSKISKCRGDIIHFEIEGMKNPNVYSLNLRETRKMSNMNVLIDGKVQHFDSHDAIAIAWYEDTLPFYEKRYQYELEQLEAEASKSIDQAAYIPLVLEKKIDLRGKSAKIATAELAKYSIDYQKVKGLDLETQTPEKANALLEEHRKLIEAVRIMKSKTAKDLWLEDLDKLSAWLEANY